MKKKEFLSRINYEDKVLLSNIFDKISLHENTGKTMFSNEFYPPVVWKSLIKNAFELNCKIYAYGVFEESERRILAITSHENHVDINDYPVDLLKITNKSSFVKLKHSDFLGSLMSQGIKREKFGDLIVEGQNCYFPACREISKFIIENLTKVGKNPCEVVKVDINSSKVPIYNFEKRNIIAASRRIDSIIASICGISRNNSVNLINKGLVLLDYEKVLAKDTEVDAGLVITIKGFGKFKIDEFIGETAKGRLKIAIRKYI